MSLRKGDTPIKRHIVLLLSLLILSLPLGTAHAAPVSTSAGTTLVLADPADPYYPLAEEIAERDGLSIAHSLDEALAQRPETLIWVISPDRMTDAVLIQFALAVRDRPSVHSPAEIAGAKSAISLGIISGATLEDARKLWLRAAEVRGQRLVAVNAANPSGNIHPQVALVGESGVESRSLTKANVLQALENADYLTFTGHGGRRYLRLDEDTTIEAADLPSLPPVVVATGSCNTFRLWEEQSIALAFSSQGAAAYAGFAYSPNEGYLIGEFDGLPFRYTWPEFTVGDVVQVQNRGALQGFAQVPYYYLLGDPRIALQDEAPYQLTDDLDASEGRVMHYTGAPAGFIPVRIPGGAVYEYVEIPGVTSASDRDPFYNSRLQMADIGEDKYILFEHKGGDFTIRLRAQPGYLQSIGDIAMDALDTALIFDQQTGGDIIGLAAGGLAWLVIGVRLLRKKASARALPMAIIAGLLFAAAHGAYGFARVDDVTITSKIVTFTPLSVVSTFLIVSAGAFLYVHARGWFGRVVALVVASFSCLAAALFGLGVIGIGNLAVFRPSLGVSLYNYNLGLQPLIATGAGVVVLLAVFALLRGRYAGNLTDRRE